MMLCFWLIERRSFLCCLIIFFKCFLKILLIVWANRIYQRIFSNLIGKVWLATHNLPETKWIGIVEKHAHFYLNIAKLIFSEQRFFLLKKFVIYQKVFVSLKSWLFYLKIHSDESFDIMKNGSMSLIFFDECKLPIFQFGKGKMRFQRIDNLNLLT